MHSSLNLSPTKENHSLCFLNTRSDAFPSLTEACSMRAKIIDPMHLVFTVIYNLFIGKDLTAAEKLKKHL